MSPFNATSFRVTSERLESPVETESMDSQERTDLMESKEPVDFQEARETVDHPEELDLQVLPESRDNREPREQASTGALEIKVGFSTIYFNHIHIMIVYIMIARAIRHFNTIAGSRVYKKLSYRCRWTPWICWTQR